LGEGQGLETGHERKNPHSVVCGLEEGGYAHVWLGGVGGMISAGRQVGNRFEDFLQPGGF